MKAKTVPPGAAALDGPQCLSLGRDIFKIECGLAFARFIASPERRSGRKVGKTTEDILAGLNTAASAAKRLRDAHAMMDPQLAKALTRVSSAASAIVKRVKASKGLSAKELDAVASDVEKITQKQVKAVIEAAEDACRRAPEKRR